MKRKTLSLALAVFAMSILLFAPSIEAYDDNNPDKLVEISKKGELRVGYVPAKPYVFKDLKTGELQGAVVDMAKRLTEKHLKVKLTWVPASWDTMIAGLQANNYDIIMTVTGRGLGRAQSVWFTKPWIIGAQSFLVRKDSNIASKADLDKPGNKIVVRLGSRAHTVYTKQNPDFFKHAEIVAVSPPALPEQEVASKRAIAFGSGMTEAGQIAKENGDWATAVILPETPKATGAGFIVPQGQHNLLHFMNVFVDDLIQSGYLLEMADKWGMVKSAMVMGYRTYGDINQ